MDVLYWYWIGVLATLAWNLRRPLGTSFPVAWEWAASVLLALLWPAVLPYLAAAKLYNSRVR